VVDVGVYCRIREETGGRAAKTGKGKPWKRERNKVFFFLPPRRELVLACFKSYFAVQTLDI
jgi:hypothetical protein